MGIDMENQTRINHTVGMLAMALSVGMWFTLIDQIRLNLAGQKGSLLVAVAIVANCVFWVTYGYTKRPSEWKVAWANVPGILFGLVNVATIIW